MAHANDRNTALLDDQPEGEARETDGSRRRFMGGMAASITATAVWGLSKVRPAFGRAFEGDLIGELTYHVTDSNSTLLDLAQHHDLGLLEVSAVNRGVDAWVPGRDRLIVLPTAHLLPETERHGVVVNLAELRLYQFGENGGVESHSIGIGRDGFSTPFGKTTITRKKQDPIWYPTADTRADKPELPAMVGPGPDNPLGRHAIYLGWPTYLIHGTNKPLGVGRRVSRGCIRMYPERVAELFDRVSPGQPVEVIHEPVKLGWHDGELYLEAHPDTNQLDELEATYDFTRKPAPDLRNRIQAKAGVRTHDIDWAVVRNELVERRGIPMRITRPAGQASAQSVVSGLPSGLPGIY